MRGAPDAADVARASTPGAASSSADAADGARASTPGPANAQNFKVASWNAGMDTDEAFSTKIDEVRCDLEVRVLKLATNCHVIGINELHPDHAKELKKKLQSSAPHLVFESFSSSHDAVLWRRDQ